MKKMTKKMCALLLALVVGSAMLFTGCGGGSQSEGGSDALSTIMENGSIKVAISLGNEPWCWKDKDGKITGMAIDLIEGFAESIEVKVEYDTYDFSGLIPAIQAGKDDIIATNLTRKPSRATQVTYTDPVGCSFGTVIVKKGKFKEPSELDNEKITLTTETGSIYADVGEENFPKATMKTTENNSDALAAVKAGRADAMVTDLAIASAACAADDSIEYLTPYIYTDTLGFAVSCSSDSYTLNECFNTYMKVIKADGTYNEIYKKYFGHDWEPTNTDATM